MRDPRSGTILIVVLGLLVLLALLATTFVTLQGIERRVTHNYTDQVRAKLAAQSGVEMAVDRISEIARHGWFREGHRWDTSWLFYGGCANPADYYDAEARNLRPGTVIPMAALERANLLHGPLETARRPSFAREQDNALDVSVYDPTNAITSPWQIRVEGKDMGFSGFLGGTYGTHGDLYSLRILDCQSQINVNDGSRWGPGHSISQNLKRILNILGAQPSTNIPGLGDLIVNSRPPRGYQNKQELLRVLNNNAAAFQRVRDYLTTASWTNDFVHNPVPISAEEDVSSVYPIRFDRPTDSAGRKIYRHGHQKNRMGDGGLWGSTPGIGRIDDPTRPWPLRFFNPALDTGWPAEASAWHAAFWAHDALNPQWIEQVSRSPINVNTATREVLTALVTDLEGFFANSRRFPAPADIFYGLLPHRYYYDPLYGSSYYFNLADDTPVNVETPFMKQSEIGHLYRTIPFAGPGGRTSETSVGTTAVPASRIVDEILACRELKPSPNLPGVDYASQRFGGRFRSWAQFNEFVDLLVQTRSVVNNLPLIFDNRPNYYYDYRPNYTVNQVTSSGRWIGRYWTINKDNTATAPHEGLTRVISAVQVRLASQAAADVLKANFNPNLHLNELNPDRTLFTLVDKTDLIVNSTEFCFVPMGSFEIESLGLVLRPPTIGTDCLETPVGTGVGNQLVATSRISTVVRLYDAEYVGLQSQFYMGEFGERQTFNPTTNNNRATESGPEPDNGPQPLECRYDGYVQLSTHGGLWQGNATYQKPKGALMTTHSQTGVYPGCANNALGTAEFGSMIHAHFALDHVAHHHVAGASACLPLGPRRNSNPAAVSPPRVKNFYLTDVAKTLTMAQAKSQAIALAQADPFFAGCTNFTTPDAYSFMRKRKRPPTSTTTASVYSFGSATTNVANLEPAIDAYFATNYPTYTTFVSLYCEYGVQVQALQGSVPLRDPTLNFPDVTEGALSGPYSPVMSGLQTTAPGVSHKFRQCHTFQLPQTPPGSETMILPTPPSKYRYAPSDLRLDGMYGELHSAIGYNLQAARFKTHQATSFWFKPNYFPEVTPRIREMVSMVNYYQTFSQGTYGVASLSYPLPFNLFFIPSYHSFEDPTMPVYGEPGRAASFVFGVGADRNVLQSRMGGGLGILSPTLNHEFQPYYGASIIDAEDFDRFRGKFDNKLNHFRHHEWHHISILNAPGTGFEPTPDDDAWLKDVPDPANPRLRLFVNGRELPGSKQMAVHIEDGPNDYSFIHGDSIRLGGEISETGIRYANGQLVDVRDSRAAPRNYYADGTIDEFYMWRDADFRTQAQDLYRAGRYYRASMSRQNDGLFTSAEVNIRRFNRSLPPDSAVTTPPGSETLTILGPVPASRKRRLIAIAWTCYGEDYKTGTEPGSTRMRIEPFFRDSLPLMSNNPPAVIPHLPAADANSYVYPTAASMSILVQRAGSTRTFGSYANEAWSAIKDRHQFGPTFGTEGIPPALEEDEVVKFRAQLRVGTPAPGAVLLATPVLDDILIFYDHSAAEYLSYVEVRN